MRMPKVLKFSSPISKTSITIQVIPAGDPRVGAHFKLHPMGPNGHETGMFISKEDAVGLGLELLTLAGPALVTRPKVICLCGSTRFYDAFQRANYELTMQGIIVLSVGFYPHSQQQAHGEQVGCTPEQKMALDELHLKKIDMADEIFVLNVGGYIGESTAREISYAHLSGKPVNYLEVVPQ